MNDMGRARPNNPTWSSREMAAPRAPTKLARIIEALSGAESASIPDLVAITGWKVRTIRGVLAGTLKHRHGLTITSVKTDGVRVYRANQPKSGEPPSRA